LDGDQGIVLEVDKTRSLEVEVGDMVPELDDELVVV
jgi:hypothetical protein